MTRLLGDPARPAVVAVAVLAVWCGSALAQTPPGVVAIEASTHRTTATQEYWTPARLANAQMLPLPIAPSGTSGGVATPIGSSPVSNSAVNPSGAGVAREVKLFDPSDYSIKETPGQSLAVDENSTTESIASVHPMAEGVAHAPYTSARLATASIHKNTLYRKVGRLFFTKPGQGDFVARPR